MRWVVLAALVMLAGCCGEGDVACSIAQERALESVTAGSARQPATMITTSCTRIGNTVNCLGY